MQSTKDPVSSVASTAADAVKTDTDRPLSSWVSLNVGGRVFCTSRTTLLNGGDSSMLARMFSGAHERPCERDSSGAFLIDRSATYFEPVLNYLRTNQLILDAGINPAGVLEEARYFGIDSLLSPLQQMLDQWPSPVPASCVSPLARSHVVSALIVSDARSSLRFQGVDLSDADLSKLDLRNVNFKYACLRRANLTHANLSGCCLERADLSAAVLDHAVLACVRMACANLEGASARHCNFQDPAGASANLEGANMKAAVLAGSNMAAINLRVATLKNADLHDCDLRLAVLAGANLENCNLSGSDLHEANLRGANLNNTAFELMLTPIHMSQTVR